MSVGAQVRELFEEAVRLIGLDPIEGHQVSPLANTLTIALTLSTIALTLALHRFKSLAPSQSVAQFAILQLWERYIEWQKQVGPAAALEPLCVRQLSVPHKSLEATAAQFSDQFSEAKLPTQQSVCTGCTNHLLSITPTTCCLLPYHLLSTTLPPAACLLPDTPITCCYLCHLLSTAQAYYLMLAASLG